MLMAYVQYNRSRIFTMRSEKELDAFLDEEHTVNMSIFIKKSYDLKEKYSKKIYYPFRNVNFN